MTDEEERKYALLDLLSNIYGISDTEYQRRVWIRGEGLECDDYCETVCNFFPLMASIMHECDKYNFTNAQLAALLKFRDDFRYYERHYFCPMDCVEMPDTPEWAKIREEAKKVLKTFNYKHRPMLPGDPWGLCGESIMNVI